MLNLYVGMIEGCAGRACRGQGEGGARREGGGGGEHAQLWLLVLSSQLNASVQIVGTVLSRD
jgi:hypothetical protein